MFGHLKCRTNIIHALPVLAIPPNINNYRGITNNNYYALVKSITVRSNNIIFLFVRHSTTTIIISRDQLFTRNVYRLS